MDEQELKPQWRAVAQRFRRPDPERLAWEQPLRAHLLQRLLILSLLAEILFLALGFSGVVRSALFPWMGFEALAFLLLGGWFLHRGRVATAAALLVISLSHVASFIMAAYGAGSAAPVLLLPTIMISGLVIGGYFLAGWTAICTALLVWVSKTQPAQWPMIFFWSGTYAVTAYLTWLFSSHLESLLAASRRAEEDRREAVVAERTRLAREVHDTLAQGFTGIVVQINAAERKAPKKEGEIWEHLEKARSLARQSLDEARRSILSLRSAPAAVDLLGAIVQSPRQLLVDDSVAIETESEGDARALPAATQSELIRIGQEALTNAIRHAGASRIRVGLRYSPEKITLRVADNGRGIPANARGLGIQGMEERMRRLHGTLAITTNGSSGTIVTADLPLAS